MIEKRFRYVDATDEVDEHIIDYGTEPHFEYYTLKGATDKLNELHEENEQLKHDATVLICSNQEYRKENEQLKKENKELRSDRDSYHKNIVSGINDYIKDHTIKVDKLPVYGNDKLIYQLPNKLQYLYFRKKWECIGEVEKELSE